MRKQVDPLKKIRYKQERLKGNCIAQSLIKSGSARTTAYHKANQSQVVISCEAELQKEISESDVTVKVVLSNLYEDRKLAMAKGDFSSVVRVDELLGKFLMMFGIKIETNFITNEEKQEIKSRLPTLLEQLQNNKQ